jgi:type IV secretion system protein VirB11
MSGIYLSAYLEPLARWLERDDITDIWVNRPLELWTESSQGEIRREDAPNLTELVLGRLARQIAAASHQGLNREHPLLSSTLPNGVRVQIVAPPASRSGVVLALRKHAASDLALSALAEGGMLQLAKKRDDEAAGGELERLLAEGEMEALLRTAVSARKTIVISGGTSTGKTTLLNALIKEIPERERLIAIEDAPEIRLVHPNAVGMIAVRGELGEAEVDAESLLQAALRMRPDRILLGELRGREAFAFLRAVNTGHPGSITTVHADSPERAIDQIALMSLLSGLDLGWATIRAYVEQVVDIIIQLERTPMGRRLSAVKLVQRNG